MSEHTKGPWWAEEYGNQQADGKRAWAVFAKDTGEHANPDDLVMLTEYQREADAKLIAVAPEMFEACKLAASVLLQNGLGRQFPELRNMLSTAISKATGR
jgi:hypothetical protein